MTPDTASTPATATNKLKAFFNALWNADDKTLRWILGVLVLTLACFNYLRDINNPPHAFWDESYYLTASERYVEHVAQYASHPPLAFMFQDLGIKLTGVNRHIDTHPLAVTKKIDSRNTPAGYDFTGIRLPSALFGVAGVMLAYLIMLRLSGEAFEAFVFSLLFVFENAYLVHFRAGHLDSYQLTFSLGSILVWLYTYGREPKRPILAYGLFGLLCGLSFMCKVNSLVILLLGGLSLARSVWMDRSRRNIETNVMRGAAVGGAFAAVVVAVFTLHVVLNPVAPDPNTEAGRKDLRYMGQTYKDYLHHKIGLSPAVIWDATAGYYAYMKHDFVDEIKTEANGSQPYQWPFMVRAINYRWDFDGKRTAYTQMIGNPVNWGLAFIAMLIALDLIVTRKNRGDTTIEAEDYNRLEAIFAMYVVFMAVHIYLGTQRVMYIYHYFIGLALSFLLVPLVFKILARKWKPLDKHRFAVLCAITVLIALSFLWISPLTFHQYLTRQECEAKNVPITLVICQPMKKAPASPPAKLAASPSPSR
ncbi:MAG: phospholipid carrier-dependent glycosyltransferase [Asticcacaulis sp.]